MNVEDAVQETTRTFAGACGKEIVVDGQRQMYQPVENQNESRGQKYRDKVHLERRIARLSERESEGYKSGVT